MTRESDRLCERFPYRRLLSIAVEEACQNLQQPCYSPI